MSTETTKAKEGAIMTRIIGITGGIASGKSTLSRYLLAQGYDVVDCDMLTKEAYCIKNEELQKAFPSCFENGILQQKKLSKLVFDDEISRKKLEKIIHPYVISKMEKAICDSDHDYLFLDIPLLFEAHLEYLCDEIWLVYVPQEIQIERLMLRNGYTYDEALKRIASQMNIEEKKEKADVLLDNSLDKAALYSQVNERLGVKYERS